MNHEDLINSKILKNRRYKAACRPIKHLDVAAKNKRLASTHRSTHRHSGRHAHFKASPRCTATSAAAAAAEHVVSGQSLLRAGSSQQTSPLLLQTSHQSVKFAIKSYP